MQLRLVPVCTYGLLMGLTQCLWGNTRAQAIPPKIVKPLNLDSPSPQQAIALEADVVPSLPPVSLNPPESPLTAPDGRLTESSPTIDGRSATIEDILKNSPDSAFKAQLLVNLALKLAQDGDRQTTLTYLDQATVIGRSLDKTTDKVSTLLLIAKAYHQLEVPDQSQALLQETEQIITQVNPPQQPELRLTLALAYGQLGATDLAQQTLRAIKPPPAPKPDFPFQTDEPWDGQLGISGQVNSYRDTTAF
ncbi:MAG: tetratricopeptide repeat protein, partial [Synechocystis sp.]